jgi:Na+/proline symporter
MNPGGAPLLTGAGLVVVGVYLSSLLLLGWMGRRARKEKSLADFYLGGRRIGFFVLLLTLYATQYSGNTLIGFAAKGYREGFTFLSSVTFMMAILGVYLLYAPKLRRLSAERQFITLSDFVMDRFRSRALATLISLAGIVAMANFILSNLKAIGYTAEAATGGQVTFAQGVIGLALIIVIYETLGGLRSVAWTDVIQGLVLFVGCIVIFFGIMTRFDGAASAIESVREAGPELWQPPGWDDCFLWFSTLIVVGLGIAVYPHAIQRIYAAKDGRTLRRAFQVMVFLPLFTTLFMLMVGVAGMAVFPGLSTIESEGITLLMLQDLAAAVPAAGFMIILFLAAVFAAIMSTVDSALLSISSIAPARVRGASDRGGERGLVVHHGGCGGAGHRPPANDLAVDRDQARTAHAGGTGAVAGVACAIAAGGAGAVGICRWHGGDVVSDGGQFHHRSHPGKAMGNSRWFGGVVRQPGCAVGGDGPAGRGKTVVITGNAAPPVQIERTSDRGCSVQRKFRTHRPQCRVSCRGAGSSVRNRR